VRERSPILCSVFNILLQTAHYTTRLAPGDCGSWVHSNYHSQPHFLGMVISTCSSLNLAYLIPAKQIVHDLHRIFSKSDIQFYYYMDLPFKGKATSRYATENNKAENEYMPLNRPPKKSPPQSSPNLESNDVLSHDYTKYFEYLARTKLTTLRTSPAEDYLDERLPIDKGKQSFQTALEPSKKLQTFDTSSVHTDGRPGKAFEEKTTLW
jgi:hypothetical protein